MFHLILTAAGGVDIGINGFEYEKQVKRSCMLELKEWNPFLAVSKSLRVKIPLSISSQV